MNVMVGIGENEINISDLKQNIPNPFSSITQINYSVENTGNVTLGIYNTKGQLIRILQSGRISAGEYSVIWNGLNENGNKLVPGIYYYKLNTKSGVVTKKMIMMK